MGLAVRARVAAAFLVLLGFGLPCIAATWVIEHNPAIPSDQIGQVVLQAADGDSILVGPGTYYEHVPVGKTLTLVGMQGFEGTILDGSQEIADREGSVFFRTGQSQVTLKIVGFTLQGGMGTVHPEDDETYLGGGIAWFVDRGPAGHLIVEDCRFRDNRGEDVSFGAAIAGCYGGTITVTNCTFFDNYTDSGLGADIFTETLDEVEIQKCHFQPYDDDWAPESLHLQSSELIIVGSTFECHKDFSPGEMESGLHFEYGWNVRIEDNLFLDYEGELYTNFDRGYSQTVIEPYSACEIVGNTFWRASGQPGMYSDIYIFYQDVGMRVVGNTFFGCNALFSANGGDPVECSENIFANSPLRLSFSDGGTAECNDFWNSPVEVPWPYHEINFITNLEVDPLFCDPGSGQLWIAIESPCAEDEETGCGLMGAWETSCSLQPVKQVSWGQLKGLFKNDSKR